ncbi:MAG: hypothetical protein JO042_16455 [Sinobacteraceae bacterium]|nr:hypothetical protein [Nevskiaceae bacterium]
MILTIVIVIGIPALRHWILSAAGWALVAEDPPGKADIIVISTDSLGAGILEASDLFHAGFATRVAIFDRPPTKVALELARRGAHPLNLTEFSIQQLHQLGISEISVIPSVVGTVDEGKVLREWCVANSIHSILFVSVPDHSRRTRRVLDRSLQQHGIQVMVRYARFSQFDPDSWWRSRGGQRVELVEMEKLLLDFLRHPF